MNIWAALKDKLERETGLQVVSLSDNNDTIQVGQIVLLITSIARTSMRDCFRVAGELAVKYSHEQGCWVASTKLLDLELTGCEAELSLTTYSNGFTAMFLPFTLHVWRDEARQLRVERVEYD